MNKIKFNFGLFVFIFSLNIYSGFILDISNATVTNSESNGNISDSYNINSAFLGINFIKNGSIYFGQSVVMSTRSLTARGQSTADTLNLTEFGPKIAIFLGGDQNFYISGAYHIYSQGTYTNSGSDYTTTGSSMVTSLGYHVSLNETFRLGASFNYHKISITQLIDSSDAKSGVSYTFTTMYPMLELVFRFR